MFPSILKNLKYTVIIPIVHKMTIPRTHHHLRSPNVVDKKPNSMINEQGDGNNQRELQPDREQSHYIWSLDESHF